MKLPGILGLFFIVYFALGIIAWRIGRSYNRQIYKPELQRLFTCCSMWVIGFDAFSVLKSIQSLAPEAIPAPWTAIIGMLIGLAIDISIVWLSIRWSLPKMIRLFLKEQTQPGPGSL
jgi:hypothetical protein